MNNVAKTALLAMAFASSVAFAANGVPSTIPHDTKAYEPVTAQNNMCIACHQKAAPGAKKIAGVPSGTPADHYDGDKVQAMRLNCMMCHMPAKK